MITFAVQLRILMNLHNLKIYFSFFFLLLLVSACSSTKHVPQGEYLLDNVHIKIEGDKKITSAELINYLRQQPNNKVLGCMKIQLATYNLSGNDTTKWFNRWMRKLGQPPVIYDSTLTAMSERQLAQALINRGYNDVSVTSLTEFKEKKKKADVTFNIKTGVQHYISSVTYELQDSLLGNVIMNDSAEFTVRAGTPFDRNALEAERVAITERLRRKGYYAFTKDYITFIADTAANQKDVQLTMVVKKQQIKRPGDKPLVTNHQKYSIRNVYIVTNYNTGDVTAENSETTDTVAENGLFILYGSDHYLRPSVIRDKCFITPGDLYNASDIDRTYEALGQLSILKYINISVRPVAAVAGENFLDAYILLSRNKKQGVTFELEGTNSEGDLGFGVGLTYQHRNLWKGSDLLTTKFRTSYESLSGNLDGLINNRYTEFAGEVGITFPKFMAPFLTKSFKQKMKATSEVTLTCNYQERPEYTRVIAGAGWKYKWNNRSNTVRKTFDLIDVNFVSLPNSTIDFIEEISNPLLRYSYEDHFIMRLGYTYYKTNRRMSTATILNKQKQASVYTFRLAAETAGNLLYGISNLTNQSKDDGAYKFLGIQYSQYVKAQADYSLTKVVNSRSSFAMHFGLGVAFPYVNSKILPFEKRFYAGGANGVRGWGVRTLGPGNYEALNSVTNFINQCGDLNLEMSIEYRAKLFWVFEGALFVDAGNIWTVKDYENQFGGQFKFDKFYKQIALAYGLGLRLDFNYFLLRFDLGFKAHNPARNQEEWPIAHPNWKRDTTLHFAVGYPF